MWAIRRRVADHTFWRARSPGNLPAHPRLRPATASAHVAEATFSQSRTRPLCDRLDFNHNHVLVPGLLPSEMPRPVFCPNRPGQFPPRGRSRSSQDPHIRLCPRWQPIFSDTFSTPALWPTESCSNERLCQPAGTDSAVCRRALTSSARRGIWMPPASKNRSGVIFGSHLA